MEVQDLFVQAKDPSALELGTRILQSQAWLVFRHENGQGHLHPSDESAVLLIGDLFLAHPHLEKLVRDYMRETTQLL